MGTQNRTGDSYAVEGSTGKRLTAWFVLDLTASMTNRAQLDSRTASRPRIDILNAALKKCLISIIESPDANVRACTEIGFTCYTDRVELASSPFRLDALTRNKVHSIFKDYTKDKRGIVAEEGVPFNDSKSPQVYFQECYVQRLCKNVLIPQFQCTLNETYTCMETGILHAYRQVEQRKADLVSAGISYYPPYVISITDGDLEQGCDPAQRDSAIAMVHAHCYTHADQIVVPFFLGVGDDIPESGKKILQKYAEKFTRGYTLINSSHTLEEFEAAFTAIQRSMNKTMDLNRDLTFDAIKEDYEQQITRSQLIAKLRTTGI